mgnify:CR=1 FL=1
MDPMEHITQLDELNFSDLYIRIDMRSPSRYRIGPNPEGLLGNFRVPQEYEGQIDIIRTQIEKSQTSEGTITHDSMRLRYSTAHVVNDQKWAAIRRIPLDVPFLDDLDMLPEALNVIRGWSRRRGVVLIGGSTGAGKTTTASSILQDFLYGTGGNGKGVFLNTWHKILGDYSCIASMETFVASKSERHPTDLAMLRGATVHLPAAEAFVLVRHVIRW